MVGARRGAAGARRVTLGRGPGLRLANLNDAPRAGRRAARCGGSHRRRRRNSCAVTSYSSWPRCRRRIRARAAGTRPRLARQPPHTRVVRRSRARAGAVRGGGPGLRRRTRMERARAAPPCVARDGLGARARMDGHVAEGCVLGVVDRVAYLHLDPVGRTYDEEAERRQMAAELAARGIDDLRPRRSRSRPGGHGGAGPHGRRDDRRQMAQVRRGRPAARPSSSTTGTRTRSGT